MDAYLLFALTWFLGGITPGGDTMLLLGKSLASGWRSAIPYSLGIIIAKMGMVTFTYLGVTVLLAHAPLAFLVLKILGSAFLVWQAWRLWRASRVEAKNREDNFWAAVGIAIVLGATNPQPWMFYLSVIPQVASKTNVLILDAIVAVGFAIVTVIYAGLAIPIRTWMLRGNNAIVLNRAVALLFVALAVTFIVR